MSGVFKISKFQECSPPGKTLRDSFGRSFDYLRISLTDRCNLRCFYCDPRRGFKKFSRDEVLTLEEVETLVGFFYRWYGVRKFRFTGGEPLLRRGFEELISRLRNRFGGEIDLSITTNGVLLREFLPFLKEKDVRVNVSLDTLKEDRFHSISGGSGVSSLKEGLDYALSIGLKMKLNTVLLRGVNEEEIPLLLQFAGFRGVEIRFIEFMPVGMEESFWRRYFLSEDEVIERLKREYPVTFLGQEGIVRYYRIDGIQAGFISTVSYPFCHQCSRLRITSNGKIYLCLFDREGYDIRRFLRPEFQEEELKSFLPTIAVRKPEGFVQWKRLGAFPGRSPVMKQVGG